MQSFKNVENIRQDYHFDPARNSVHRSSLLVPEIPGCEVNISFLNHFLLKRGYQNVACRITGIDEAGDLIETRFIKINEPIVYSISLRDLFNSTPANYLVEFYASDNLFIPFPAVMINHKGEGFLNSVHSYNRVLNDVFEDDRINKIHVREASIDVCVDDVYDTFVIFAAGQMSIDGELKFELMSSKERYERIETISAERLTTQRLSLRRLFPNFKSDKEPAILKIEQPQQLLFYGRLFAGISTQDGAFSANHSYYDTSNVLEYWDDGAYSYAIYPIFRGLNARIRMYPIMSPGVLKLEVAFHDHKGLEIGRRDIGLLSSPSNEFIDADINDTAIASGINPEEIGAFSLYSSPVKGGTPKRVNHQLVYSSGKLSCSINASLENKNEFVPGGKTGRTWGQTLVGGGYNSWLALSAQDPEAGTDFVEVHFYDNTGSIGTLRREIPSGCCATFDMNSIVKVTESPRYVWFMAESKRPDLKAIVVSQNLLSGHCSGEHGF